MKKLSRCEIELESLITALMMTVREIQFVCIQALVICVVVLDASFQCQNEIKSLFVIVVNASAADQLKWVSIIKVWHSDAAICSLGFNQTSSEVSRDDWISFNHVRCDNLHEVAERFTVETFLLLEQLREISGIYICVALRFTAIKVLLVVILKISQLNSFSKVNQIPLQAKLQPLSSDFAQQSQLASQISDKQNAFLTNDKYASMEPQKVRRRKAKALYKARSSRRSRSRDLRRTRQDGKSDHVELHKLRRSSTRARTADPRSLCLLVGVEATDNESSNRTPLKK